MNLEENRSELITSLMELWRNHRKGEPTLFAVEEGQRGSVLAVLESGATVSMRSNSLWLLSWSVESRHRDGSPEQR